MFIQTEQTPNPATLKFLPGCEVLPHGLVNFENADVADKSPLAQRLFNVKGVVSIMLGEDFIAVTKSDDFDWSLLKPEILTEVMDHFTTGGEVMLEGDNQDDPNAILDTDDDIIRQIKEILQSRVAPAVAQDGGHIVFDRFEEGILYLEMRGACAGCPSSTMTLKMGIENLMKHFVPEVLEVRAINEIM